MNEIVWLCIESEGGGVADAIRNWTSRRTDVVDRP